MKILNLIVKQAESYNKRTTGQQHKSVRTLSSFLLQNGFDLTGGRSCTSAHLLVDYGTRNGTCNVARSMSSVLPDGSSVNLGKWVIRPQRRSKDTSMKPERRVQLHTLLVDQGLFKWSKTM